jgi:hypothetical protein
MIGLTQKTQIGNQGSAALPPMRGEAEACAICPAPHVTGSGKRRRVPVAGKTFPPRCDIAQLFSCDLSNFLSFDFFDSHDEWAISQGGWCTIKICLSGLGLQARIRPTTSASEEEGVRFAGRRREGMF